MRLTIKRKNIRRFASLSALGAGAIASTAIPAEANIIHVVDNQKVAGWDAGFPAGTTISIGGERLFTFQRSFKVTGGGTFSVHSVHVTPYCQSRLNCNAQIPTNHNGAHTAQFGQVEAFSAAREWPGRPTYVGGRGGFVAFHDNGITIGVAGVAGIDDPFNSIHKYFLFRFPDKGKTLYGWGQLNISVTTTTGPDVTLIDYAYDTTGALIPAGKTSAPAPEPSQAVPLALAALVLGAPAIRRWRAAHTA